MPRDATRRGDKCIVVVAVASASSGISSEPARLFGPALIIDVAGSAALSPCRLLL
jgi:hypothetical protein